jgi:hypothetical protein
MNWSQFQIETVADYLQRCQCAIILYLFHFQTVPSLILNVLRGDCNVVELRFLSHVTDIDGLVRALAENKSLVRLGFSNIRISDDNWTVLCQSLLRHPKPDYLRLRRAFAHEPGHHSNERKTRRTLRFLEDAASQICATRARRS